MRTSELFKIARKGLWGAGAALPIAGFAVALFCLCFAGAVFFSVRQEKAQPYEIVAYTEQFSQEEIAKIAQTENVTAVTPVLEVPVRITVGVYTADLTLTGIDVAYLQGAFSQGSVFPEESVMPYIVLNTAACRQFTNGEDRPEEELPAVDWLGARFSIQTGEGTSAVVSKVAGILEADENAAAYISLSTAKKLLRKSGGDTAYTVLYVRVKNIGCAQSVADALVAQGGNVVNATQALEEEWDKKLGEMTYLIVTGGFCLLCTAALLAAREKAASLQNKGAREMLKWMGMANKDLSRLSMIRLALLFWPGMAAGALASLSLPAFLFPTSAQDSIFLLGIPWTVLCVGILLCGCVCTAALLPVRRHAVRRDW